MKTEVVHIGITDKKNLVHAVTFGPGVNVITGKSSTGKSALIEIFDYCFGSSDFTIPEGVITEHAEIYFVVLRINEIGVVLARKGDDGKVFIKQELKDSVIMNSDSFKKEYFDQDLFLPLADFKKELRRYFGSHLQITDIDENLTDRDFRGGKKPTPSIRSFTSFMLQHQNLIANKHAIFYRFDEKEKREQTIDHFKVFAGFAPQEYFIKRQELDKLQWEERRLNLQKPREEEVKEKAKSSLEEALEEYAAVSGKLLDIGDIEQALINPTVVLEKLRFMEVDVVAASGEYVRIKRKTERELAIITAGYRRVQNKLKDIESSIEFAENYKKDTKNTSVPQDAELHVSQCPFCHVQHSDIEQDANELSRAIVWLNDELNRSEYSLESFREAKRKVESELGELNSKIILKKQKIRRADEQVDELEKYRTQYELALKAKLKVESVLESILEGSESEIEAKLKEIKEKINELKMSLRDDYDVETKLKSAESSIRRYMKEISQSLEFEESYRPVDLRFSLDTFDLWNVKKEKDKKKEKKVYLRSMGSGANWLSCHVTLFLALHRYFCKLGNECSIPTVLFLDQPSQVYFPSILDDADVFSPEELSGKISGKSRTVDEDITAVTNLYTELVRFCKDTLEKTGIEPQIIVTDHADNLKINNEETTEAFEKLVDGRRWRTQGFIKFPDKNNIEEDSD